jgi:hypothetical protein
LVKREVLVKYRGSLLGVGWSFLYPLLLLLAFTMVFGGVFGGRWSEAESSRDGMEMALFIYCGLAVFTPFSEVITSSPRLLIANQNFIKKIIFPVEILPLVAVLAAMIHCEPRSLAVAHLGRLLLVGHGSVIDAADPARDATGLALHAWRSLVPRCCWRLRPRSGAWHAGAGAVPDVHATGVLSGNRCARRPAHVLNRVNPLALTIDDLRLNAAAGRIATCLGTIGGQSLLLGGSTLISLATPSSCAAVRNSPMSSEPVIARCAA